MRIQPENETKKTGQVSVQQLLRQDAIPLPSPESPHFGEYFDHLGDADIVLLGESTHGSGDFYRARAAITQRLVRNHDFKIIALEADWPDASVLDGYVRDRKVPDIGQPAFSRFPEWVWRNEEFRQFLDWLRKYNDRMPDSELKAGIYGLDLYGMQASINAIIDFLKGTDSELADIARKRYECFEPWLHDPVSYGKAAIRDRYACCESAAVNMLMDLMGERRIYLDSFAESFLDISRNAELVANAEKYYRAIFSATEKSWNLRDRHMFDTLRAIRKSRRINDYAPMLKTVVWAHNSHIGDARATDLGRRRGELNLGQLCRENSAGEDVRLVGFGTATGEVAAAHYWGGPVSIVSLMYPIEGSFEELWMQSGMENALLDITGGLDDRLQRQLEKKYQQRAVGVIYRPDTERTSHYLEVQPAKQFDHYVWLRDTGPVTPLAPVRENGGADLYPFGV